MPYLDEQAQGPLAGDQPPKPGFFGGLLNTLFPAGASGASLSPEQLREEQQLALRKAGLSLLAGGGPRPYGTRNFGADLAQAFDPTDWQHRLSTVAEQSATIGQMQAKAKKEAQAAQIMSQFPPVQGETDQQRDQRLSKLVDAYQQAGLMDYAKAASDLRTSVRAPGLVERRGVLYDHWGNPVSTAPGGDAGIDGSQLYSTAVQRLNQFSDTHDAVMVLGRARAAQPTVGQKLDPVTSATLISAAQRILGTHNSLAQDEDNPLKALAHAHSAGDLGKFLAAILSSGGGTLTTAQRDQILKLVDPVIADINAEQSRVKEDIHNIFRKRWKSDPALAESMWEQLPTLPDLAPGARIVAPDVDQNAVNRVNRALGRPHD
jgi:hypothetical protein